IRDVGSLCNASDARTLDRFTIRAAGAWRSNGRNAWVTATVPKRLAWNVRCQQSSDCAGGVGNARRRGHVDEQRVRAQAFTAQLRGGGLAGFGVARADQQLDAEFAQLTCGLEANAFVGARDQCEFAHAISPGIGIIAGVTVRRPELSLRMIR